MLTRLLVILAVLGALSFPAVAATKDETEIDVKTREVAKTLRCTVCQSESIWESGSPFARQVRESIREQVEQGKSAEDIRAYFLDRYGDYILMQPPARGVNWVVWIGPFAVLIVGGFLLYRTLTRWVASTPAPQTVEPLDESSRKRIERELHS